MDIYLSIVSWEAPDSFGLKYRVTDILQDSPSSRSGSRHTALHFIALQWADTGWALLFLSLGR